jgi:hypothetical protein
MITMRWCAKTMLAISTVAMVGWSIAAVAGGVPDGSWSAATGGLLLATGGLVAAEWLITNMDRRLSDIEARLRLAHNPAAGVGDRDLAVRREVAYSRVVINDQIAKGARRDEH